ncbi:protein O-linked-mannose beta-1,2-N-acetylglucosaminyltransferase 1-like isoform X2 [Ruditapes philippinarum]|uniref:protein O-linked-mannose beta-1,2-N-acetylglucosaminyltransferase 1-like isoform X2 n=1 Tax=Ruditapes philippinarum TaxID=129788 RepID=UPI00295BFA7E|nr:protein O-linked-mannose beta-1,2-N-acetylglucosaminyltransferase 1-like isoform X2 [Ruditapes philippinarum]
MKTSTIRRIKTVLLVMLMVSVMINISFIMETNSKLQYNSKQSDPSKQSGLSKQSDELSVSKNFGNHNDIPVIQEELFPSVKIDVLSSKERVVVKTDGKIVYKKDGLDEDRGIHVLVLNQATGAVMATRLFDTYLQKEDEAMIEFLDSLSYGRILVFTIKDEGTFQLQDKAKMRLGDYGSDASFTLFWRDMWVLVPVKWKQRRKGLGEMFSRSPGIDQWGEPVSLSVTVDLVPGKDTKCKSWPTDAMSTRRERFCDIYEGYGTVCDCDNPQQLEFPPVPLENGNVLDVPLIVIASDRPHYLFRTLKKLLQTPGVQADKIIVFIDGIHDEPLEVTRLLNVKGVHHEPQGEKNARISQHYKASLTATFNFHPDAEYVIILEEDLDVSPDFFNYFYQTKHLLDEDQSLYCISAWNDQGYEHSCQDPALLYRIETMPGLGWMMKKSLFKDELEPQWPGPDKRWDWDMWMRHDAIRKSRECIIPDISRTYHFGSKGLNINPYFQELYFQSHKLLAKPNVKLKDVDRMTNEKYEVLIKELIKSATVLDHSKNPCADDFIPQNTEIETYVMYIHMKDAVDFETWKQIAKCYKLWDLDVRGFHKSMWRQYLKGKHLVIIGAPASPYAEFKPADIPPIDLESKEQKKEGT